MTDTGSGSKLNPSAATTALGKAQVDAMVSASVQFTELWKQLTLVRRSRQGRPTGHDLHQASGLR